MIRTLKYLTIVLLTVPVIIFYGCEKEIGDVIIAEINNPYEGNYIFSITSELTGQKDVVINNRGSFSFFIQLRSSVGTEVFPVIITGVVDENGNLAGKIYRAQYEIGSLSGQIGYGDFSLNDSGYSLQGSYSMAGSN